MGWSNLQKVASFGAFVGLAVSLAHDGRAAGDPDDNGIFVQAVKTYDEGQLENLLNAAIKSLSSISGNGFDQQSLIQALGKTQGAQLNQAGAALNVSGPGSPTPPQTSLPTAPTLPTTGNVSSIDLLNEQTQLALQIINVQMLLGSSLNDLSPQGDLFKSKRKRTTLGFPIYITVPPSFRYQQLVAEVEVSVCTPSDAANLGAPTLINLLPREKTYNVASIVSKGASIGGGGVAGIFSLSGSLMRGHQTYYLVRDQDTLAIQRPPALGSSCPVGGVPVTFAWQFRPVLGQSVVRDGLRQTFAQISLPGSENAPNIFGKCPAAVYVRTGWRRYDQKTGRVGALVGKVHKQALRAESFSGPPAPDSVNVQDNGDATLTVTAYGSFWSGTSVRIGGSVQTDGAPGFEHNDSYIRFKIDPLSFALNGASLVKDGVEVKMFPPDPDTLFDPSACEENKLANPAFYRRLYGTQGETLTIELNEDEARLAQRDSPKLVFQYKQYKDMTKGGTEIKVEAALSKKNDDGKPKYSFTVPMMLPIGQYSITLKPSKDSKEEIPAGTLAIIGIPAQSRVTVDGRLLTEDLTAGYRGETLTLTLKAVNTKFAGDAMVTFSGTGVTVGTTEFFPGIPDTLRFQITIDKDAPLGLRGITVTSGGTSLPFPASFIIRGNQAKVVPYDAATSLVTLPRNASEDTQGTPKTPSSLTVPEVMVIGSKVFGLRDTPFVERTDDHVSLLVANDLIRTSRRALWKNLVTFREQTYSLLASETGISYFNITAIIPLSQPATTSSTPSPAPATVDVTVTTNDAAGGKQVATGTGLLAIGNGSPSLFSVSFQPPGGAPTQPASGAPGDTLDNVVITGAFTHFLQSRPIVAFSDPRVHQPNGAPATDLVVTDDTHLTLRHVTIDAQPATAASVNVTVTSGPETAVGTGLFNVVKAGPRITLNPLNTAAPNTNLQLTITGTGTKFKQTPLAVKFGDPNITLAVPVTTADSDTQLTITVNVAANAASGLSDVTVSSGSDSVTGKLVINPNAPALVSISPAAFRPGQTYAGVTIVGQNTTFGPTSAVTFSSAALKATNPSEPNPTGFVFDLNVSGDAASSATPPAASKGSNVYAITGSNLTGMKILVPQVDVTFYDNNDTFATFSLTDTQVQQFKYIFVQHGNEYRVISLSPPPATPNPPATPTGTTVTTGAK